MKKSASDFESARRGCLSRYFKQFPAPAIEARTAKAIRLLAACKESRLEKPRAGRWESCIIWPS